MTPVIEELTAAAEQEARKRPEVLRLMTHPDESMRVSHETVYRSLFIQARGVLKKELLDHLRSKRRMRRSRHASVSGQSRGQIVDAELNLEELFEIDGCNDGGTADTEG